MPDTPSPETTPTRWVLVGVVLAVVVVGCLVVLVVAFGGGDPGTRSVTSAPTSTSVPGVGGSSTTAVASDDGVAEQERTLDVGGLSRTALVLAPTDVGPGERLPAVVVLHGMGVSAKAMSNVADWRGAVAEDRFVAVFPQGVDNSWNLGPCCPPASLRGVDDVAFLDAVVAELRSRADIDRERMYLTGFSNGALMVYDYTCERSDVFAAVAPMSGSNVTGCSPTRPVSLLHQHGDLDLVVPYGGGIALGSLVSSAPFPPVESSVAAWAADDGCAPEPTVMSDGPVRRSTWGGCAEGTEVQLVRVSGKGHDWLRSGAFDPLSEMLEFFGLR